jgi:hypothetical protein
MEGFQGAGSIKGEGGLGEVQGRENQVRWGVEQLNFKQCMGVKVENKER